MIFPEFITLLEQQDEAIAEEAQILSCGVSSADEGRLLARSGGDVQEAERSTLRHALAEAGPKPGRSTPSGVAHACSGILLPASTGPCIPVWVRGPFFHYGCCGLQ